VAIAVQRPATEVTGHSEQAKPIDTTYYFYCDGTAVTIENSSNEENAQFAKETLLRQIKVADLRANRIKDCFQIRVVWRMEILLCIGCAVSHQSLPT
jgi:hypothetical protein